MAGQTLWDINDISDYEYKSKLHWYLNDMKEFTKPCSSAISLFNGLLFMFLILTVSIHIDELRHILSLQFSENK